MTRNPQHAEPLLLTLHETARLLKLSPRTVWQWAADGKLPHLHIGRCLRFPRRELEAWISEQVGRQLAEAREESQPAEQGGAADGR